jgi:hypothetical protein
MTEQKAFNYLKELSRTHPKAFRLCCIYRDINKSDSRAYYLFEFAAKLPFTKSEVNITFSINELGDKEFVTNLTDKIDNIILGSDYDELKDMLARNDGLVTISWDLYKADCEFYLKNLNLTQVSTFFDKVSESSAVDIDAEHLIFIEINSLITTPVYHFTNFDGFVTDVNCLPSKARNYCNKNIVSKLAESDTFTFTSSFIYKPAHSIVRITKTQGNIVEFPTKYLEFLMPYVELTPNMQANNTSFDL